MFFDMFFVFIKIIPSRVIKGVSCSLKYPYMFSYISMSITGFAFVSCMSRRPSFTCRFQLTKTRRHFCAIHMEDVNCVATFHLGLFIRNCTTLSTLIIIYCWIYIWMSQITTILFPCRRISRLQFNKTVNKQFFLTEENFSDKTVRVHEIWTYTRLYLGVFWWNVLHFSCCLQRPWNWNIDLLAISFSTRGSLAKGILSLKVA